MACRVQLHAERVRSLEACSSLVRDRRLELLHALRMPLVRFACTRICRRLLSQMGCRRVAHRIDSVHEQRVGVLIELSSGGDDA
jgi:hypothetical protein